MFNLQYWLLTSRVYVPLKVMAAVFPVDAGGSGHKVTYFVTCEIG